MNQHTGMRIRLLRQLRAVRVILLCIAGLLMLSISPAQAQETGSPVDTPGFDRYDRILTAATNGLKRWIETGQGDPAAWLELIASANTPFRDEGEMDEDEVSNRIASAVLSRDQEKITALTKTFASLDATLDSDINYHARPSHLMASLWGSLIGTSQTAAAVSVAKAIQERFPATRWSSKLLATSLILDHQYTEAAGQLVTLLNGTHSKGMYGYGYLHETRGEHTTEASTAWASPIEPNYVPLAQRLVGQIRVKDDVVGFEVHFDLPEVEMWLKEVTGKPELIAGLELGPDYSSVGSKYLALRLQLENALAGTDTAAVDSALRALNALVYSQDKETPTTPSPLIRWLEFRRFIHAGKLDDATRLFGAVAAAAESPVNRNRETSNTGPTSPAVALISAACELAVRAPVDEVLRVVISLRSAADSVQSISREELLAHVMRAVSHRNPATWPTLRDGLLAELGNDLLRTWGNLLHLLNGCDPIAATPEQAISMLQQFMVLQQYAVGLRWLVPPALPHGIENLTVPGIIRFEGSRSFRISPAIGGTPFLHVEATGERVDAVVSRLLELADGETLRRLLGELIGEMERSARDLERTLALLRPGIPAYQVRNYFRSITSYVAAWDRNRQIVHLVTGKAPEDVTQGLRDHAGLKHPWLALPSNQSLSEILAESDRGVLEARAGELMTAMRLPEPGRSLGPWRLITPREAFVLCLLDSALHTTGAPTDSLLRQRIANGLRQMAPIGGIGMTELESEAEQIVSGDPEKLSQVMQALCRAEVAACTRRVVAQDYDGDYQGFTIDRSYLSQPTSYATAWPDRLWHWLGQDDQAQRAWLAAVAQVTLVDPDGIPDDSATLNSAAWHYHLAGLAGESHERMALLANATGIIPNPGRASNFQFPGQLGPYSAVLDTLAWTIAAQSKDRGMDELRRAIDIQTLSVRTSGYRPELHEALFVMQMMLAQGVSHPNQLITTIEDSDATEPTDPATPDTPETPADSPADPEPAEPAPTPPPPAE